VSLLLLFQRGQQAPTDTAGNGVSINVPFTLTPPKVTRRHITGTTGEAVAQLTTHGERTTTATGTTGSEPTVTTGSERAARITARTLSTSSLLTRSHRRPPPDDEPLILDLL
jgi:hypothetical protein